MKRTTVRFPNIAVVAALILCFQGFGADRTFTNPLLPSGADPWAIHYQGWYFYTHTTGRNLTVWKTRRLEDLATAEKKVVWTPPASGPYSKGIWAPELHRLDGKWYLYFAADDGHNRNHRLYVLENIANDPLDGEFTMKGKLETPGDHWSIDASVFKHASQLYLLWSGWQGDENGRQDIYLARMTNPWTVEGPRILVSKPDRDWEEFGTIPKPGPDDKPQVYVNEGPEALERNGRVFIIYSASGCWTDHYVLGMVYANAGANLMSTASWHKVPQPVFDAHGGTITGTVAAGHNSFFKSPDGTQDWILYHANKEKGQGCGASRNPRAQPFTWSKKGFPVFGEPLPAGVAIPVPSETRD